MDLKHIVIVGGGFVGSTLAEKLSRDGYEVTLVEADPSRVREVSDALDVQVVEGNGATASALRRAGVERANLVVATTDSDEANVVVGLLAVSLFGVPRVVVRIRDSAHEEGFALVGGEHPEEHVCVNTDRAAVDRIASLLEVPGAVDVVSFMDGQLLVAGFRIGPSSDFKGLRVDDMQLLFAGTPTLAAAIHRGADWVIPHGEEQIEENDLVYFAIDRASLDDVLNLVGVPPSREPRVMVAGAGHIALELARRLESEECQVVLIEQDAVLARQASEILSDTVVIHGRVTDQSLLEDEEIDRVSTFVAVTEDHETNLVAGLLAKRLGAQRALVLLDNPALVALVGDLGIDAIISPRSLAIGLTLQHIRGRRVRSAAALLEDRIEIVEAEAEKGSPLTKGAIRDLKLPRGVLVAALRRGERLLVPRGDDRIEPGDRVLVFTTTETAPKLTEFLSP